MSSPKDKERRITKKHMRNLLCKIGIHKWKQVIGGKVGLHIICQRCGLQELHQFVNGQVFIQRRTKTNK